MKERRVSSIIPKYGQGI